MPPQRMVQPAVSSSPHDHSTLHAAICRRFPQPLRDPGGLDLQQRWLEQLVQQHPPVPAERAQPRPHKVPPPPLPLVKLQYKICDTAHCITCPKCFYTGPGQSMQLCVPLHSSEHQHKSFHPLSACSAAAGCTVHSDTAPCGGCQA